MSLAREVDEEEVRILLMGNEEEIREGLSQVHEHYERRVCAGIRRRYSWLSPEDLADVWGETLAALIEKVRSGKFDAERSLPSLLYTISKNKTDADRKRPLRLGVGPSVGTRCCLDRLWASARLSHHRLLILSRVTWPSEGEPECL